METNLPLDIKDFLTSLTDHPTKESIQEICQKIYLLAQTILQIEVKYSKNSTWAWMIKDSNREPFLEPRNFFCRFYSRKINNDDQLRFLSLAQRILGVPQSSKKMLEVNVLHLLVMRNFFPYLENFTFPVKPVILGFDIKNNLYSKHTSGTYNGLEKIIERAYQVLETWFERCKEWANKTEGAIYDKSWACKRRWFDVTEGVEKLKSPKKSKPIQEDNHSEGIFIESDSSSESDMFESFSSADPQLESTPSLDLLSHLLSVCNIPKQLSFLLPQILSYWGSWTVLPENSQTIFKDLLTLSFCHNPRFVLFFSAITENNLETSHSILLINLGTTLFDCLDSKADRFYPAFHNFKNEPTQTTYEVIEEILQETLLEVIDFGCLDQQTSLYQASSETIKVEVLSPSPLNSDPIFFPIEAFKSLFQTLQSLENELKLSKRVKQSGEKTTPLFSFLKPFLPFTLNSPAYHLASSNLDFGTLGSLLSACIRHKLHKNYAKWWAEYNELMIYFDKFRVKDVVLHEALILNLLKNQALKDFLKKDEVFKLLISLGDSLGIPSLDKPVVEKALTTLLTLQQILSDFSEGERQKIINYGSLSAAIMMSKPNDSANLITSIHELFPSLLPILQIFLAPQLDPIHLLARSRIRDILRFGTCKEKIQEFPELAPVLDCKTLFESNKENELGLFLTTPIDNFINQRKIEGYHFVHRSSDGVRLNEFQLDQFNELSLRKFSFKGSSFHDFKFESIYFEECDFSECSFTGTISFSQVYVDSHTAATFLKALALSNCQLQTDKGIILFGHKRDSKVQKIPHCLKAHVNSSRVTWVEDYDESVSPVKSSKGETLPHLIPPSEKKFGLVDLIKAGAETLVGTVWGSTSTLFNEASDESNQYKELELQLTTFQQQLKDALNQVASSSRVQQIANQAQLRQQQEIERINQALEQIKVKTEKKQKILSEQQLLLQDPCSALFYQTLLADLSSFLLTLFLLQNSLGLIRASPGTVNKITNKEDLSNALLGRLKEKPQSLKDILDLTKKAACLFIDHAVELASIATPAFAFIPAIGKPLTACIQKASEINDRAKIKRTQHIFNGMSLKSLDLLADAIARKVSFAYQDQLQLLTEKNMKKLGEYTLLRFAIALLNNALPEADSFELSALLAIRATSLHFTVGGIPIPLLDQTFQTKNKTSVNANALFTECGIAFKAKTGKWQHYSNDKKINGASPLKDKKTTYTTTFGYMRVSRKEWKKHFRHSVTLDDEQLPHLLIRELSGSPLPSIEPIPLRSRINKPSESDVEKLTTELALMKRRAETHEATVQRLTDSLNTIKKVEFKQDPKYLTPLKNEFEEWLKLEYTFTIRREGKMIFLSFSNQNLSKEGYELKEGYERLRSQLIKYPFFEDSERKKTEIKLTLISSQSAKDFKKFLKDVFSRFLNSKSTQIKK